MPTQYTFVIYLTFFCCRHVSDELNKMRMKEKYLNNQHNAMSLSYIEVRQPFTTIYTHHMYIAHNTTFSLTLTYR